MIEVALYAMVELGPSTSPVVDDPYDPEAHPVTAVVTDPAGARTELSPFWDGGAWLFRWRPTQLGSHTVSIQGAVDEEHAIEVRDEGLRGPVVADGYGFRLPDGSAWTRADAWPARIVAGGVLQRPGSLRQPGAGAQRRGTRF